MIDKRAFMIGFFASTVAERRGAAAAEDVNNLCRASGMTPLDKAEVAEIKEFLSFVGDVMESNGRKMGLIEEGWAPR